MGQMADDCVNGLMCSLCGVCFKNENGFPVLCASCWEDYGKTVAVSQDGWPPITPEGWQRTLEKELGE